MEELKERFSITITDSGVAIQSSEGPGLLFTAVEALMMLDILRHEEETLRKIAEEASPLSFRLGL
ncbi:MAG: hypothetical protein JXD19_08300 [Deltaproteobacteria bacterium]|nr:hypothetical protein [Deltaproteobacteria bacterium]